MWYLSRHDAPDSLTRQPEPIFYDFFAQPAAGAFVSDDRMFVNRIRGQAFNCNPQPPTSIGHFHVDYAEFWFIMEGQISYNIEGLPFFVAEPGDIVYVRPAAGTLRRTIVRGSTPGLPSMAIRGVRITGR
jgi:hypothetical protein